MQEKTWAMRGEATRADRPADSLLEPEFEFEHASKPAPVRGIAIALFSFVYWPYLHLVQPRHSLNIVLMSAGHDNRINRQP